MFGPIEANLPQPEPAQVQSSSKFPEGTSILGGPGGGGLAPQNSPLKFVSCPKHTVLIFHIL